MSKSKENVGETILQYFKAQNRPYSVNDIAQILKEHGKAAIQKSIDLLVVDGKLIEKTYGKQKVYAINQNQFVSSVEDNIGQMDLKISTLTHEVTINEEAAIKAEKELKSIISSITTEEASKQLIEVSEENKKLENKFQELSKNRVKVSTNDFKKVQQLKQKSVSEWRKRKRICVDMMDAILEGYPKGKKALIEEVGIELDEDGTKIPS